MKSTITSKGMGTGGTTTSTTYIKGNKMRTDTVTGDTTRSTIFDIDTHEDVSRSIRRRRKSTSTTCTKLAADIAKNVQVSDIKASVKPNGQTKQISGKSANGYDMEVSVPAHDGRRAAA